MTKLISCKHCGHQIAKTAKICPSCGGKNKRTTFTTKLVAGFIVFSFVMGIVSSIKRDSTNAAPNKPQSTTKQVKKNTLTFPQFYKYTYNAGAKGITQVLGFVAPNKNEQQLKAHCQNQYKGATWCFYYFDKFNPSKIESASNAFDASVFADRTNYYYRVDISVDGTKIFGAPKQK